MRITFLLAFCFFKISSFASCSDSLYWTKKQAQSFTLYYTAADSSIISTIEKGLGIGSKTVMDFFHSPFKEKYEVYIFPNRNELDKQ